MLNLKIIESDLLKISELVSNSVDNYLKYFFLKNSIHPYTSLGPTKYKIIINHLVKCKQLKETIGFEIWRSQINFINEWTLIQDCILGSKWQTM